MSAKPLCFVSALLLASCDACGGGIVHRTAVDGVTMFHSRVVVDGERAGFQCIESGSDHCHYTLFDRACASTPQRATPPDAPCLRRVVTRFVVVEGAVHEAPWRPGLHVCVAEDALARDQDCQRVASLPDTLPESGA
jgi:hypothetical protein